MDKWRQRKTTSSETHDGGLSIIYNSVTDASRECQRSADSAQKNPKAEDPVEHGRIHAKFKVGEGLKTSNCCWPKGSKARYKDRYLRANDEIFITNTQGNSLPKRAKAKTAQEWEYIYKASGEKRIVTGKEQGKGRTRRGGRSIQAFRN